MIFPHQTRLERMRLMVTCIKGAWALQSDRADGTVRYNHTLDEEDQFQGARCMQECILIQDGPVWTHSDTPARGKTDSAPASLL